MGQYANFYNSVNGDRVYDASSFEEWLAPFFKNGVFADCLQVTALENMNISVSSGSTYINGKTKTFDVSTTLTLSTANSTLARIDNIVIRRNDEDRDFFIMVQEGTYANQPTAPQPIRTNSYYDIVLAHVYVAPSVVEITQADITDTRMDENLCGYVVGLIDQIDFNQIKAQFDAWLSQVQGDLQDILLDGSVINDSSSSNLTTYSSNKIEQLVDGLELPTASATTKGGIKVGSGLSMDGDTMSATVDLSNYYTKSETYTKNEAQAKLVSGSNIKTVNGTSVLGSGNINISTGAKFNLLWTNSNPTGNFNSQTISLDLSSYKAVLIQGKSTNSDTHCSYSVIVVIGNNMKTFIRPGDTNSKFLATTDGVVYELLGGATRNAIYRIYGIA